MADTYVHRSSDTGSTRTGWIIILNSIPFLGVLALGWGTFELVLIYCLENAVIWLFTVLKIVVRDSQNPVEFWTALAWSVVFTIHFGAFAGGYGLIVYGTFSEFGPRELPLAGWPLAALSLIALHAIEWRDDVKVRGLAADGALTLMAAPYKRLLVMHLCIMGFATFIELLGDPGLACGLILVLKTAFDIHHHHRKPVDVRIDVVRLQKLKDILLSRTLHNHIGGKQSFESFADMAESSIYRQWMAEHRVTLNREEFEALETYVVDKLIWERE